MILRRASTSIAAILCLAGGALAVIALALAVLLTTLVPTSGTSSAAPALMVGRVHETYQPQDGKIFVLAIGNDARSGNPDRALADAIHIIGVNTKTMRGGVLNFPRDSYVPIPGYGTAKINEALLQGGPELLAKTLENLTGIRLDYWAMVGFEGFEDIIHGLGGVRVRVPRTSTTRTGRGPT